MRVILKPMGALTIASVLIGLSVYVFLVSPRTKTAAPTSTVPKPHLVGHWNFDKGNGTVVSDSAVGGHSGTLQGSAGWGTGPTGKHSLSLPPGSGSFVDIPQPVVDTSKSFTVTACVKMHLPKGFQTIVSIDGEKVSGFYLQLRDAEKTLGFTFLPGDDPAKNNPVFASMKEPPVSDQWYHLTGVHDATAHTISLYVNGVLAETKPLPPHWRASGHTLIGRGLFDRMPVDFMEGQVDDVRFYDVALPATQIRSIADEDLPVSLRKK